MIKVTWLKLHHRALAFDNGTIRFGKPNREYARFVFDLFLLQPVVMEDLVQGWHLRFLKRLEFIPDLSGDIITVKESNTTMDIIAHGLWAGLGVRWLKRRHQVNRSTAAACVALSMAPDIAQLVPVAVWVMFGTGSMESLIAYVSASPGGEPLMPESIALWSHHLHCVMHSAVVAGVITLILWPWRTQVAVALAGWWLHIVIDVFTHSADFYPVPVLYPITQRGFDGLAWNTPWFLVTNYVALAACAWVLFRQRRK